MGMRSSFARGRVARVSRWQGMAIALGVEEDVALYSPPNASLASHPRQPSYPTTRTHFRGRLLWQWLTLPALELPFTVTGSLSSLP